DNFEKFLNPPHYGVAKAGVIQLTKYYASLLGEKNITVNCITPGPYPNKEVQKSKDFIGKLVAKTSLKRIGRPEDLAGAFVFLASEAANYLTGQNIIVDGGWTIK
ncbi:MAG: SDR family oxidoreductase, partial [Candidatus Paceibacterota bacterium]